jgi:prefoldin alpha subunit
MEDNQQEVLYKLSFLEQQINQLQQQLQAIEQAVVDMNSLKIGLEDLKGSEGKEILAPIGRGLFIKAKVLSENLITDIGSRNFTKKSVNQAQEVIKKQVEKLKGMQKEVEENLERAIAEINNILSEAQNYDNNPKEKD